MIKEDDMEKLPKYILRAKDYDRFRAIKRKGDMAKTNVAFWKLQKYRVWEDCPCCGKALLYTDTGIKDYVCLYCDKEFADAELQKIRYERQTKLMNVCWSDVWEEIVRNSWCN